MATKQSLLITTTANRADVSDFPTLTGFAVDETTPDGTSTRYLIKTNDDSATWQKYDTSSKAWTDVATQELTPASVMTDGRYEQDGARSRPVERDDGLRRQAD